MTTRINTLNVSDVALVDARDLGMVMQYMVSSGRGLAMLRGVTEAELREIESALWDELSDNPAAAGRDHGALPLPDRGVPRPPPQRPADAHRLPPDRTVGAGGGPDAPQCRASASIPSNSSGRWRPSWPKIDAAPALAA